MLLQIAINKTGNIANLSAVTYALVTNIILNGQFGKIKRALQNRKSKPIFLVN